jgi:hypothetical protein
VGGRVVLPRRRSRRPSRTAGSPLISGQKEFDAIYEILHGVLSEAATPNAPGTPGYAGTKPPIDPVRGRPPLSRPLPTPDLDRRLRIVFLPGPSPEDVVVDADGGVWTGLADGKIVRIDSETGSNTEVADTGGRPLGLAVARDGRLLICDSHRGLMRMDTATGELETLAAEVKGRPLKFCSNVVESSDGTLYFTESTDRLHYEFYKGAFLDARGSGGPFRRDPDGTVTALAAGLYFANGVTLTADESALVFAETSGRACRSSG